MTVPDWRFWQILVAMLIGIAILATAVWGGFHSDGHYKASRHWENWD